MDETQGGTAKSNNPKPAQKGLDEELEESFPASDPPAQVQPGHNEPAPSSGFDAEREGQS